MHTRFGAPFHEHPDFRFRGLKRVGPAGCIDVDSSDDDSPPQSSLPKRLRLSTDFDVEDSPPKCRCSLDDPEYSTIEQHFSKVNLHGFGGGPRRVASPAGARRPRRLSGAAMKPTDKIGKAVIEMPPPDWIPTKSALGRFRSLSVPATVTEPATPTFEFTHQQLNVASRIDYIVADFAMEPDGDPELNAQFERQWSQYM